MSKKLHDSRFENYWIVACQSKNGEGGWQYFAGIQSGGETQPDVVHWRTQPEQATQFSSESDAQGVAKILPAFSEKYRKPLAIRPKKPLPIKKNPLDEEKPSLYDLAELAEERLLEISQWLRRLAPLIEELHEHTFGKDESDDEETQDEE